MRVLLVAQGYPPRLGGTEVHTATVAQALAARGYDVSVFAGAPEARPGTVTDQLHGDVRVRRVAAGRDVGTVNLHDPWVRAEFERALRRFAPDVVHVQHLLHLSGDLIEAARSGGTPVVVTLHDLWFQCPATHVGPRVRHPFAGRGWGVACAWHRELRRPGRMAWLAAHGRLPRALLHAVSRPGPMRRQLELADALIAPSRFIHDSFVRFGVPEAKLEVLEHGTHVRPVVEPRTYSSPTRFGFVGALVRRKGLDVLCRAFGRAGGDSTLHLYGSVQDERILRKLLDRFGPRVRYEGRFAPDRAAAVYDSFDVLVVPSIVGESFGLTALEAQARGLPVIASRAGALVERVRHDRDGLLVPPGDVRALELAIARLRDPAEVRRLAHALREPSSIDSYAGDLERIYARVLPRSGHALEGSVRRAG